ALDIVFGASCVIMLLSIIWMFAQDYYREFKVEARDFRDVEEAIALRELLRQVPDDKKAEDIKKAEAELATSRDEREKKKDDLSKEIKELLLDRIRAENKAQATKADYDSEVSKYNIAVDQRNAAAPDSSEYKTLAARADDLLKTVQKLEQKLNAEQLGVEEVNQKQEKQKAQLKALDDRVDRAERKLKDLTDEFDRFAKLAELKRWKAGDAVRAWPVIDAFASPLKIDQITLTDL